MDAIELLVGTVSTMHAEQREDHAAVILKLDRLNEVMTNHTSEDATHFAAIDKRLAPIESLRNTLRWGIGTLFAAAAVGACDFLFNHLHVVKL